MYSKCMGDYLMKAIPIAKTAKLVALATAVMMIGFAPLNEANARGCGGYYDRWGYFNSHSGRYHRHHRYHRCHKHHRHHRHHKHRRYRGRDIAVGFAIGTLVGAVIANSNRPSVTTYPPQKRCFDGDYYYNCDSYAQETIRRHYEH